MSRPHSTPFDFAAVTAAGGVAMIAPFAGFLDRVLSGVVTGLIIAFVTWAVKRITQKDKT